MCSKYITAPAPLQDFFVPKRPSAPASRGKALKLLRGRGILYAGVACIGQGGCLLDRLPKRKSIRLEGYDYARAGAYYVTICVGNRQPLFGQLVGTTAPGRPPVMQMKTAGTTVFDRPFVALTPLGKCIDETIQVANRNNVRIDKYIIMPNHVHMIVILDSDDRGRSSLRQVVRNIKSYVTKRAGKSFWQPRFHDRIIRSEKEYQAIWQYIDENPEKWAEDEYYRGTEPL